MNDKDVITPVKDQNSTVGIFYYDNKGNRLQDKPAKFYAQEIVTNDRKSYRVPVTQDGNICNPNTVSKRTDVDALNPLTKTPMYIMREVPEKTFAMYIGFLKAPNKGLVLQIERMIKNG